MNWKNNKKKIITFTAAFLFTVTGTYNAVVINSDSSINDIKFVKRLDEVYGVVKPGRMVAASVQWQKLEPKKIAKVEAVIQEVTKIQAAPKIIDEPAPSPAAAVHEELELRLVEVINPTKWKEGIPQGHFSGYLSTNNGIIETMEISLPDTEGVSISYSEMTGNVFEYDFNGEVYSGMMYQVDQYSYMVTLSNGPLEGTRLRFSSTNPVEQQELDREVLADNYQIEAGSFGGEEIRPEVMVQNDQAMQAQGLEAQSYNFNQEAL